MKRVTTIIILFITAISLGQNPTTFINKANDFFNSNVTNGRVNYKGIKNDPAALNGLVALAKRFSYTGLQPTGRTVEIVCKVPIIKEYLWNIILYNI